MTIGDELKPNTKPNQTLEGKEKINLRILIADDNEITRKDLKFDLEARGYRVKAVENGRLLIDELIFNDYDLVVTDNQMPKIGGIEALRMIRSTERLKNLPVIVLTGDDYMEKEIEKLGGVYIGKPPDVEKLFSEIERISRVKK